MKVKPQLYSFVIALLLWCVAGARAQGPTPLFVDATGADNFKLLFLSKAHSPIAIDGKLDDEAWKDARPVSDFGHAAYGARRYPFPKTEARFLWDDRYLYVALTCYEDTAENMERHNKAVEDKAKPVYERDCVELHINGNNDNATKFQIWFLDTREKQIFWHYDFGWGILVNEDYGLVADWDYASSRGPNYWQTEGRIALADVQIQPRIGYIFGMNPTRFRFDMQGTRDDGLASGGVTQFLTWSTQGGDHQDVRLFGKCVLVDKQPASVEAGLRLAYPDLDKRTVMVQTGTGFDIFDHGVPSRQSYLEKLKQELTAARASAKRLNDTLAQPAPNGVDMAGYVKQAKDDNDKLAALDTDISARTEITVAELNDKRKDLQNVSSAMDNRYWTVQQSLLLAGGTTRPTVDLKPAADAPVGRDEPENMPDPAKRVTPHVEWAKPFAGGKTTALIFTQQASSWGAYQLTQRMDLDAKIYSLTGDFGQSIGPATDYYMEGILLYPQKKAQLQKLMANKYQAYIFLDCQPAALPVEIQYLLAQRVQEGAATVIFQGRDWGLPGTRSKDSSLREGIPYRSMTRLVTAGDSWLDHRGMEHPSLDREAAALEVPEVTKTSVGKGWVVNFNPGGAGYFFTNPLTPHYQQDPDERFQAEYYLSLDSKIILDAVGKLSPRRLLAVDCGTVALAPGAVGKATAPTDGPAFNGQLRTVVRNQWGVAVADTRRDVTLAAGKSDIALELPALDAGNYYVDAWLLKGDQVVDWASQRFRVQGKAAITGIKFVNRTVALGDNVKAEVTVANAAPADTLMVAIRDTEGRILRRVAGVKIAGGRAQLDVPLRGVWQTYQHLDVTVEEGGRAQDSAGKSFYALHPPHDDFTVFTDGEGFNEFGSLRRQEMLSYGVNLFEDQGNPEDILGDGCEISNRYWLSGSTNETGGSLASDAYHKDLYQTMHHIAQDFADRGGTFTSTGDDSGVQADFADNNPNWVMPLVRRFAQKYPKYTADFYQTRGLPNGGEYWRWLWNTNLDQLKAMKLQPGDLEIFVAAFEEAYPTIGEFNRASGTSFTSFKAITADDIKKIAPPFSPDVMGFQDWLHQKYGTVTALNAAWGANEKSFETIAPGVEVGRLTAAGEYAAALDKRTYLEDLFIRHMKTAGEAVHSVDPAIGVGQGAASFNNVIPEVLHYTDTFAPYLADVNIEIGRSTPHKWVGQTLGVYGGKAVNAVARRQQAWHGLFSGGNFMWFWSACTGGLMGDLSTNPNRSGAMLQTVREMKRGIASTLLRGQRQHDGIAILHSRDSGHMDGVVKEMSTQANSESSFQNMVEDLGMQYRYISTADVESGILGRGEFKVVMLPYTQIVTPKEATAIEAFVRDGGSVIADLRAGTFSTAGKPLSPGTLDELFGIGRSGPRALPQRGTVSISGEGLQPCELVGAQVDGSIVAKTATALGKMGDTPCLLVNSVGKGKAILCNLGVGSYDFLLKRNQLGPAREAFAALLAQAGARSRFVVTSGGKAVPGVELAVFKRGDAQYLTAEKRSFEYEKYPMSAEIALDGQYYVTDLRSGKSLGRVNRIPVQFEGLSCHVWSMMPYQVTALNVNLPKTVKQGSDLKIEIALKSSAPAAPQVVRIEMTSPSGATPIAMRLVDTQRGNLSCTLPIAFNEEKGTWQVAVTDISSGLSKTLPVEVTRP